MTLTFDPPVDPEPRLTVAMIGPPKTGKTAGASSAPGPILYLNADLPERMRYARLKYGDKVKPVTVTGMQTLADVTREVYNPETEFKTVVVDPVGEVYRILLDEASKGATRPTLNQYGDTAANLERFCRKLCKGPLNVVLVFHDHPVKDEGEGVVERLPWTGTSNPKMGRAIMGMVQVVAFTGVVEAEDETRYVAQLIPAKGRPGGDGFNCLGKSRAVDLTEWIEAIKAHESNAQA